MNTTILERQTEYETKTKEELLQENMGLIYSYAKRYDRSLINDMVQEGAIGLLTAAAKYEPNRGTKFSTYATFWINQAINRGYQKTNRSMRLPSTTLECISKIKKVITKYMTENHRPPTAWEIEELTGISQDKIDYYQQIDKNSLSLDAIINEHADSLVEYITDEGALEYQTDLDNEGKDENINAALSVLSDKELDIVRAHYGFDNETKSLAEIGRDLNISRERVRQLKERALNKIRNSEFGAILANYL